MMWYVTFVSVLCAPRMATICALTTNCTYGSMCEKMMMALKKIIMCIGDEMPPLLPPPPSFTKPEAREEE